MKGCVQSRLCKHLLHDALNIQVQRINSLTETLNAPTLCTLDLRCNLLQELDIVTHLNGRARKLLQPFL